MPATQIPNPGNAFAPYFPQQVPQGVLYSEATAGSAIAVGAPIALSANGSAFAVTNAASAPSCVGISLDAVATGGSGVTVRYVNVGLAGVSALAAIAAGAVVSPSAGGVAAASATIGSNIGVCITGTAAAGPITIYVSKM